MMKQNRNVESSFVAAVQENNELFWLCKDVLMMQRVWNEKKIQINNSDSSMDYLFQCQKWLYI